MWPFKKKIKKYSLTFTYDGKNFDSIIDWPNNSPSETVACMVGLINASITGKLNFTINKAVSDYCIKNNKIEIGQLILNLLYQTVSKNHSVISPRQVFDIQQGNG